MAVCYGQQITFSAFLLQDILDPTHKLVKLAEIIDWEAIYNVLSRYYSLYGRQALPIRLMVGLHILKHLENMSDEQSTQRLRGDLYWMYFCGVDPHILEGRYHHLDSSSMTKFRVRIGVKGFAYVEQVIAKYLLEGGYIKSKVMTTDSFCLEKNIKYPTDSGLLDKGRKNLLKGMNQLQTLGIKGVKGLRSYSRKAKKIILGMIKLGKDKEQRIKEGTLELAKMARHVLNKSKEFITKAMRSLSKLSPKNRGSAKKAIDHLKGQQKLLERIIYQAKERFKGNHIPNKIYSLHEPQVIVIRKGKGGKPNEYGSKANISIDNNGFIVTQETYCSLQDDSKLLEPALGNWEKSTNRIPEQVNGDRGYSQKRNPSGRIKKVKKVCIPYKGKKKNPNAKKYWFKKGQKIRSTVEGVIGHLKTDHRLDNSRYRGFHGDNIGVFLATMAWNLNKLNSAG